MQMYLLKNMIEVSICTLLISALSIVAIAEQSSLKVTTENKASVLISDNKESIAAEMRQTAAPEESNPPDNTKPKKGCDQGEGMPNMRLSQEKNPTVPTLKKEEIASLNSVNPGEIMVLQTPGNRSAQRVAAIDIPENLEEKKGEWAQWNLDPHTEEFTNLPQQKSNQLDVIAPPPSGKTSPDEGIRVDLETEGLGNPSNEIGDQAHDKEAPGLVEQQEMPFAQSSADLPEHIISPDSFDTKPIIIRPSPDAIPIEYDGSGEDGVPPPPEDPDDPTSEGRCGKGQHKCSRAIRSVKLIPIIRMGEYNPNNNGLTVIKPWNS